MPAVVKLRPKTAPSDEPFPEGLHRVTLTAARISENPRTGTESCDLVFEAPPYRIVENVYLTEANQKRVNIFAKRVLGGEYDPEAEEQDLDFERAVGGEFVIDVFEETFESDKGERKRSKLQYAGVWPLDHDDKKVREFLASGNGKPAVSPPAKKPAPAAKAAAKPTFDDV